MLFFLEPPTATASYVIIMSPLRRTMPQDQRDATKHLTFSEREANRDANENFKLGRAAARKKDHAAAMLHYHMALKLQREIMGHEHPIVATTLDAIGLTLMEAGDINVCATKAKPPMTCLLRSNHFRFHSDFIYLILCDLI